MKMNRLASVLLPSFLIGSLFLAVGPASAQTSVTSTVTLQVSGTAPAVKTGLNETVTFSGPLVVTARVVTDPTLGPSAMVSIDGRGVIGTGKKTGATYLNECEASLARPFAASDTINTTFAFFLDAPGSYMSSKTGLLTLTLTYDTTTMKLTGVSASVSTL